MDTCSIDGCDKPVLARTWCKTHYNRWYKTGNPLGKGRKRNICKVEGCNEYVYAYGYCSKHHWRWERYGDPLGKAVYLARDNTREHNSWRSMIQRCYWAKHVEYTNYGGRGIKVCERWLEKPGGFKNFLGDMGPRPEGYTLDRINTNGDYTPENCRWATYKTQNRNRRNNATITYNGETHILKEWSEILGLDYKMLAMRHWRYKWTGDKLFSHPPKYDKIKRE